MTAPMSLRLLARALGGEISGGQVLAPGPSHSREDRSLAVRLSMSAADGFVVHSFAGDDAMLCRDHVREKLNLPAFDPARPASEAIDRMAERVAETDDGGWKIARPPGDPQRSDVVHVAPAGFVLAKLARYRDAGGALMFCVARYEKGSEKTFRPMTYWSGPDGRGEWRPKAPPSPRPPYGLDRLSTNPDAPVLVVEGEKTVGAAQKRFPRLVVVTSLGGALAAAKTDWSALAGRDVTIWPDADPAGASYAAVVSRLAEAAGAKSVSVVDLPPGLPVGWDLADDLPAGVTMETIERALIPAPADGPIPLFPPLPNAEPYPVETLGPLAPVARAIANKVQVPLAIAGQSVLAAASLVVQAHADVVLPFGQKRPTSLFFATVAESGARKTSADAEALWPVYRHERNLRETHTEEMKSWRITHAAWSAERKKVEGNGKIDFEERKQRLGALGSEPEKPLAPFIVTGDLTPDGLTKNWSDAHAALGVFSAEGGVFTGSHGMSDDNKLRTAAMLSELWDGKPVKRIRAMDGVTILPGRRLSLHVMIQPEAAAVFMSDATLRDQGLLSRILVAAPPSLAGARFYRDAAPEDDASIRTYGARLLSVLETPATMAEGKRNELQPRELTFSAEAREIWITFFDHVEGMIGSEDDVRGVQDFAAKAAEHAARIAGVLTLYENIRAEEIGADAMANATELASFYVGEALRLQQAGRTNPKLQLAQRLLDWLRGTGDEQVLFRDLLQYGPGALRTKDAAETALAVLIAHGWVEEVSKRPRVIILKREALR